MRARWTIILILLPLCFGGLRAEELEAGLIAEYFAFDVPVEKFPIVANKNPVLTRCESNIDVKSTHDKWPDTDLQARFYVRWSGKIKITVDGTYRFYTNSDDGSRLFIDDRQIVNNGGLHGMEEKDGAVELKIGYHDIRIDYFENDGEHGLIISWEPPESSKITLPADVLFHVGNARPAR